VSGFREVPLSKTGEFAALVEKYKSRPEFYFVPFADANQRGLTGDTLLHAAVIRGSADDIDVLMSMDAEINANGGLRKYAATLRS